MASTDDVFRGFCEGCVAARDVCPLARNLTATQLENALYAYFDEIRANPIPVADTDTPGGGYLVDYTTVKSVLLRQLNFPSTWPAASQMLAAKAYGGSVGLAALQDLDEALPGIKCSDVLEHTDDPADLRPVMEARRRLSRFGDAADHFLFRCAQWKLPAKERYDGDFDVETRNPVLIINNRFDPVTPLASARNVSQTFKGSVLLEQNSYGVS
jgi:pimeloyl-ACP methyl ester carboxylesterase